MVRTDGVDDAALADAFVETSRSLVAVAARSLAAAEPNLTIPQHRLLLVISMRPGVGVKELAHELRVQPSTITRMCDRLVAKGLIERVSSGHDRREIDVHVTSTGMDVLRTIVRRRRREIMRALARLDTIDRDLTIAALRAFAAAVDADDRDASMLGWP